MCDSIYVTHSQLNHVGRCHGSSDETPPTLFRPSATHPWRPAVTKETVSNGDSGSQLVVVTLNLSLDQCLISSPSLMLTWVRDRS